MGFLTALNAFFHSPRPLRSSPAQAISDPVAEREARWQARLAPYRAHLHEDFQQAVRASTQFEQRYGEFTCFLYRPDFDRFLRKQVLPFWESGAQDNDFLDHNRWIKKHPFNFPGPFYTGESDTCGTGIDQAPANVATDVSCCEYVFKQPTTYYELLCLLNAAAVEVFDSYACNGNDHWTYAACEDWWRNRDGLLRYLAREDVIETNAGQAQRYLAYLQGEAELDLRRYCYFLEHGVYPPTEQTCLPKLGAEYK